MPSPERRPPVRAESREPKSIRFAPAEWSRLTAAALARGVEPSAFARECCLAGLMLFAHPALLEAHMRALAVLQAGAERCSA